MSSLNERFEKVADRISETAGRPVTFLISCLVVVVWAVSGPFVHFTDTWQLVINTGTTIVTFLMVFLIQSTQNRDGKAMQVKLDELLRAVHGARPEFIGVEKDTERVMDEKKAGLEAAGRGDARSGG